MDQKFLKEYKEIADTLIEYGWIVSPYMIGKDFSKVHKLVMKIRACENPTQLERQSNLESVNLLMTDIIYHPLFRAFFVYRAKELTHTKTFSHHIERAMLHYYKNDYFSTVLCLLPAIEGCLLSYYGWEYGSGRKPNLEKLICEIEKCRTNCSSPTYKLYSEVLSQFLRKWIFSDTSTTDTTFSYLNRHYVLHGMGASYYYSLSDTHRLIMFFDVFIEFLSIEEGIRYVFTPEDNSQINQRSEYYFKFIEKNIKSDEMLKTENKFLSENEEYIKEVNVPKWKEIVIRAVKEDMEFWKNLKSKTNL